MTKKQKCNHLKGRAILLDDSFCGICQLCNEGFTVSELIEQATFVENKLMLDKILRKIDVLERSDNLVDSVVLRKFIVSLRLKGDEKNV